MNPLQDLKDIRTPPAIESWPPAYGWWLLFGLTLLLIIMLSLWIVKKRRKSRAKRQALTALHQLDGLNPTSNSQLNQLLKRVAITYFPEHNVQQMHGQQWTCFLSSALPVKQAKRFEQSFELFQQTLYQPHNPTNSEFSTHLDTVETWIKYALPPRKRILEQKEHSNA